MNTQVDESARNLVVISFAALVGWFGVSSGIYAVLTGEPILGIAWFLGTAVFVAGAIRASAYAERIQQVPTLSWVLIALVTILVGASRIFDLFITEVEQFGTILIPELFRNISAVIYVLLLGVFLWQLIGFRQSKEP